jgi:hypothetical protein
MSRMFVLVRTVAYATLFIGLLLVFLPSQLLSTSGIPRRGAMGPQQIAGMVISGMGGLQALWCVLTLATGGRRRRLTLLAGWSRKDPTASFEIPCTSGPEARWPGQRCSTVLCRCWFMPQYFFSPCTSS